MVSHRKIGWRIDRCHFDIWQMSFWHLAAVIFSFDSCHFVIWQLPLWNLSIHTWFILEKWAEFYKMWDFTRTLHLILPFDSYHTLKFDSFHYAILTYFYIKTWFPLRYRLFLKMLSFHLSFWHLTAVTLKCDSCYFDKWQLSFW